MEDRVADPSSLRVAVIGGGAIGASFAAVFGDAGAEVRLAESDGARREAVPAEVARRHGPMALSGRARGSAEAAAAKVRPVAEAAEAADGADLVIEAGPERLEAKQAIFAALLAAAPAAAPLATASSAMTASEIVSDPAARRRCLVAHPANPPTVLRAIELAPAPETAPETMSRATAIFRAVGFEPVTLGWAIPGFVMNRLQGAVLREAYRLVAEGVVDAEGVDRVMREMLGPRWALSGPFETAELNTPGGIRAHAARMGPAYRAMGEGRGERDCAWPEALLAEVERSRRRVLAAEGLPARAAWREQAVARLVRARDALVAEGPAASSGVSRDGAGGV